MAYRTSIGLDVHARSIAAAAFVPETGEVIQKSFLYGPRAVAEWAKTMPQPLKCVYEPGPTEFDLQRKLAEAGVVCCAGAVSKMPRPSSDRVKTDKRDGCLVGNRLSTR